jgi:IclR helix-turn-helix domain
MGVSFDSAGTAPGGAGRRELLAFERALARISAAVDEASGRESSALARLRAGLVAFLAFFDDEPWWGRLLVVDAPVADRALAMRCRQRVLGVLSGLLDDGAPQAVGELAGSAGLATELVCGGVFAVIRARVLEPDGPPLVELAPSLMAFIATPRLGQAAAAAELTGVSAPAPGAPVEAAEAPVEAGNAGRGQLPTRVTRRTLLVLDAIAGAPGASNREVACGAGLSDEGQTSRLLGRLRERGLVENVGVGVAGGLPNAWLLTARGRRTLELTGAARRAEAASRRARRIRGSA